MSVHFLSKNSEWETPQWLFDRLNEEFFFTLDVCASYTNAKCEQYYTKAENGLTRAWFGTCWMNPPYGTEISDWVERAYEMQKLDGRIVGLLPARTDTRWFHDYVMKAKEVRLIRGRLKFVGAEHSAPFPSMIVVWGPQEYEVPRFTTYRLKESKKEKCTKEHAKSLECSAIPTEPSLQQCLKERFLMQPISPLQGLGSLQPLLGAPSLSTLGLKGGLTSKKEEP